MKSRAILIKREGDAQHRPGRRYEIEPPTTLGRSPENAVVVDDPDVSRQHCVIEYEASEFLVRDLRSANGTYLNGKRVSAAALRHGDVISLGGVTFTFQSWAPLRREGPGAGTGAVTGAVTGVVASTRLFEGKTPFDSISLDSGALRMHEALEKYRLLYQVGEIISSLNDPDVFFQLILEQIFHRFRCDRGVVLLGKHPEELEMVATRTRGPDAGRVPLSSTILRRVLEGGESLLVRDSLLDDRLYGSDSVTSVPSRSILCAALSHGQEVLGAIQIEALQKTGAFVENDLEMLAAIGRQAAAALVNLRLATQKERLVQLAELRRSLPADMAERLLPDRARWAAPSRAPVVVMVADLRPLGAAGDEVEPAAHFERLKQAVDRLTEAVHGQQGTVGKLTGDALMAFWGAPVEWPDSPLRACRAALESAERVPEAALGLHAGMAMVGTFGGTTRSDYTALGPTVDLASRICGLAPPGQVLASPEAHERLLGHGLGEWVPVERLTGVKGPTRLFHLRGLT
jgi:adenylate cyclase